MAANAHRTFKAFEQSLNLTATQGETLREARTAIRQRLRQAFSEWRKYAPQEVLFMEGLIPQVRGNGTGPGQPLRPKFRTQGSQAYNTANQPAHMPPQQMDMDDGAFLPTSFVGDNGQRHPIVASQGYFKVAEGAVAELCEERGWTLKEKDTCIRVQINREAHVDCALYAVPDHEFTQLMEISAAAESLSIEDVMFAEEFRGTAYYDLDPNQIMLAHREKGWQPSDPRALEDWFTKAQQRHGGQLRRVCRYLKAWRDQIWEKGGPSSIALMACTVKAYDEADAPFDDSRDDLAVQAVAQAMVRHFRNPLPNPAGGTLPSLCDGWTWQDREDFAKAAERLYWTVAQALQKDTAEAVIRDLRGVFGDRVPGTSNYITMLAPAAPAVVASDALRDMLNTPEPTEPFQKRGPQRFA